MDKYSTKQFMDMVGIKFSTLRFYERIQLLEPQKDSSNNYRLYTPMDAFVVTKFRRLQSLGFSSKDAVQIINDKEIEDFAGFAAAQIEELKRERILNRYRIRSLELMNEVMSSPIKLFDFKVSREEDLLFHASSRGNVFPNSRYDVHKAWVELLPLTRFCRVLFLNERGEDPGTEPDFGIAIPAKHASLLREKDRKETQRLKRGECLRFYSKNLGFPEISRDVIKKAMAFIQKEGYEASDHIYFYGIDLNYGNDAIQLVQIPLKKST